MSTFNSISLIPLSKRGCRTAVKEENLSTIKANNISKWPFNNLTMEKRRYRFFKLTNARHKKRCNNLYECCTFLFSNFHPHSIVGTYSQITSITIALAPPPPLQIPAAP
jgi:hypothetical protein